MALPLLLFLGHIADRFPYAHKLILFMDLLVHATIYINLGIRKFIYKNEVYEPRALLFYVLQFLQHDPVFHALVFGAVCRHGEKDLCPTSRASRTAHTGSRIIRAFFMQQLGTSIGCFFALLFPIEPHSFKCYMLALCFITSASGLLYALLFMNDNEDYADYSHHSLPIDRFVQSYIDEYNEMTRFENVSHRFLSYTYTIIGLLFFCFASSSIQSMNVVALYLHNVIHTNMRDIMWVLFSRHVLAFVGLMSLVSWYWASRELAVGDVSLVLLGASGVLVEFSLYLLLYIFTDQPWLLFFGAMFAFFSLSHKSILLAKLSREIESTSSRPKILVVSFMFTFAMIGNIESMQMDFVTQFALSGTMKLLPLFLVTIFFHVVVLVLITLILMLYYCRERNENCNSDYYSCIRR